MGLQHLSEKPVADMEEKFLSAGTCSLAQCNRVGEIGEDR